MPGRSLTPPDVRRQKLAAYKASRAQAQACAGALTAAELELARAIMREVQAGSNVAEATARRELHAFIFWDWLARDAALLVEWDAANRQRGLVYGEQPVGISDDAVLNPAAFYTDANGVRRVDPGFVQLQKLRIQTRQWDAERLQPGRYASQSATDARGPVAVHVTVQRFVTATPDAKDVGQTPSDVGQNYAEGERVAR